MRVRFIFTGVLMLILAIGCKKSAEFDTDNIPVFNSFVAANVSTKSVSLKATFTGINAANVEKCGFELSEKNGTSTVVYSIAKPSSAEIFISIDTAFRESLNLQARAWLIVGGKKFFSGYTYFTGKGYPAPELTSISKAYAIYGEVLYLNGKYFTDNYIHNNIVVKIDNIPGVVVSATFNKIGVQMVDTKTKGKVKITVNAFGKDAVDTLEIENYWPEIYSVTPDAISFSDEITIRGKFRTEYSKNIFPVQYNYTKYKILKYTDDVIIIQPDVFMVCDSAYHIYFSLANTYSTKYVNSGYKAKHKGNWLKLKKPPFVLSDTYSMKSLSCNGFGYMIWYNSNADITYFWKYDPQSDTWTKLPNFPGRGRYTSVFVECKGLIYYGQGSLYTNLIYDDFWKFDPANNIWTKCADLHSSNNYWYYGFAVNIQDTVCVFSDYKAKYNQTLNTWQTFNCELPVPDFNGKMFVYEGNYFFQKDWQIYQYNPVKNSFTLFYSTYDISYYASVFTANNRVFMYAICKMWEVDLKNKRVDERNDLVNYYSKDSYWSINLFSINGESYFLSQPNILSKFSLSK